MTDRPVAGVLGCLAALAFIVAFAVAAVTRPETSPVAASHATLTSPTSAREGTAVAGVSVPTMARVAALPGLRLPVHRHVKHAPKGAPPAPAPVAVAVAPSPVATPAPVVAAAPTHPVAPAKPPARPATPHVGETFDSSG